MERNLVGRTKLSSPLTVDGFSALQSLIWDPLKDAGFDLDREASFVDARLRPAMSVKRIVKRWDEFTGFYAGHRGAAQGTQTSPVGFIAYSYDDTFHDFSFCIPNEVAAHWSRDVVAGFVAELCRVLNVDHGWVSHTDDDSLFRHLGYVSPFMGALEGYGWFTILNDKHREGIDADLLAGFKSWPVETVTGTLLTVVEAESGPEVAIDELDRLDDLVAPIRTARDSSSALGLLGSWYALSRLDRALMVPSELELGMQGPPWKHPDYLPDPDEVELLKPRPPLEWWDDPDGGRPTQEAFRLQPEPYVAIEPPTSVWSLTAGDDRLEFVSGFYSVYEVLVRMNQIPAPTHELSVSGYYDRPAVLSLATIAAIIEWGSAHSNEQLEQMVADRPWRVSLAEIYRGPELEVEMAAQNRFLEELRGFIADAHTSGEQIIETGIDTNDSGITDHQSGFFRSSK